MRLPPPVSVESNFLESKKPIAISLGVSPYSPWDLEMANLGYRVLQYDASIESAPYNHENITFFKKFVGVMDNENTISLQNVITQNDLREDSHNILQCDIEDCEWEILENIDLGLMAKFFPQVLFEFHNCNPENDELSSRRLKVLESLRRFYTPIFTHFNYHDVTYYNDGLFLCGLIEVSFLRNDLIPKDSKPFSGYLNISNLSAPNSHFYPDVPACFKDL
ncbi:hypothetical protein DCO60_01470 [Helicobacter saguini]|uniref:hypothetical protein n=1 Tax=Helicobacter saguini TaxID=1548018 RepID=UPI000E59DFA4|nr:hypothetical protein [Helicobacter saguini]MWV61158.1 hypothetical protein [Helicobacter saguini]